MEITSGALAGTTEFPISAWGAPGAMDLTTVNDLSGLAADEWVNPGPLDKAFTCNEGATTRVNYDITVLLDPNGDALTSANIGTHMALRNLAFDLRSADPFRQSRGGRAFSGADRSKFLNALENTLRSSASQTR